MGIDQNVILNITAKVLGSKENAMPRKAGYVIAAVVLVALGLLLLFFARDTVKEWIHSLAELNPVFVFALIALLPIFGFSVSVVYLLAGLKFGPAWGTLVVGFAIAIHLLGSHFIARSFLKERLLKFLERRKVKIPHIPDGENAAAALMIALVPGFPYAIKNYLLPLAGIPLKTYFWICLPVHLIRSTVAIFFGDLGIGISSGKVIFLLGFFGVKVAICAYLIYRLRKRFKEQAPRLENFS